MSTNETGHLMTSNPITASATVSDRRRYPSAAVTGSALTPAASHTHYTKLARPRPLLPPQPRAAPPLHSPHHTHIAPSCAPPELGPCRRSSPPRRPSLAPLPTPTESPLRSGSSHPLHPRRHRALPASYRPCNHTQPVTIDPIYQKKQQLGCELTPANYLRVLPSRHSVRLTGSRSRTQTRPRQTAARA